MNAKVICYEQWVILHRKAPLFRPQLTSPNCTELGVIWRHCALLLYATGLPNIPKDPRSTVKWVPTCQQIDIPVIKNICNSGMTTTRPPIETTSVLESFPDVPDTCLTHTEGHCSIPLGTTILKHLTHSAGLN